MGKMDCPWSVQIHTKTYFKKELKALLLYSFLFLVAIFPLPFRISFRFVQLLFLTIGSKQRTIRGSTLNKRILSMLSLDIPKGAITYQ